MAQSGLHGLIGGYLAKAWVRGEDTSAGQERSKGLKFGFVLGAIIPDADLFLLGPMFLFNSELALKMHRSFTHSLVTTAAVVALVWLLASGAKRDYLQGFALGLGGGMVGHIVADIVLWFGGVQILWPLGYLGVPQSLNLWTWLDVPRVVSNLLGAADYLAFGLYYLFLAAAARRTGVGVDFLGRLKFFTALQWVFLALYTVLAFFLGGLFDIAHYAAFILFFFPVCLYVTVKMRPTIHAL